MGLADYDQDVDWQKALEQLQSQPQPEPAPWKPTMQPRFDSAPQPAQAAAPQPATPLPPQTPQQPTAGGSWQQAADLLSKLDQSNKRPAREMPASEAPPSKNDAGTIWAIALSLLGNNGRDLGQIAEQSVSDYNRRLAAWEARQSPDAQLDRSLKLAQLEKADREAGVKPGEVAQVAGVLQSDKRIEQDQNQFVASQEQQKLLKQADIYADQARTIYTQQGMDARAAADRAQQEKLAYLAQHGMNERQAAEIQAQNERQDKALAAEDARLEKQQAGALNLKALELAGKQAAAIPGTTITDAARYRTLGVGEQGDISKQVATSRKINNQLSRLQQIMLEPPSSSNEAEYNNILKYFIGDESKAGSTGVLSNPEYERYLKGLPSYTSLATAYGRAAQINGPRAAMEVMRGQNPAYRQLQQLQVLFAKNANEANGVYGFRDDALTPYEPQQPQQPQAAGGAGAGMGGGTAQAAGGAQQPEKFDPVALKLPGTWRPANPALQPAAPTPAPPQPDPAAAAVAQPGPPPSNVSSPQAAIKLPPITNGVNVKQPVSKQELDYWLSQGWKVL